MTISVPLGIASALVSACELLYGEQRTAENARLLSRARQIKADLEVELERERAGQRRLVNCLHCHKTHSVLPSDQPCAEGAWVDA